MNKKILVIIGVGIATVLVIGGWMFFSKSRMDVSEQPMPQQETPSTSNKETTATSQPAMQEKSTAPSNALTTTEKVTARSFSEKILKLLQSRDYSKVYDLLTDEDKAAESRTEYVKRVTETSGAVTITSSQIKEVLEEQGGASVQYVVSYDSPLGSGSETGILTLVQKNGKWFLSIGAVGIKEAVIKGVGDEIALATVKFKVNVVKEEQTTSTSYGSSATAKDGTKFVVVNLTITNLTKEGINFPEEAFILTDNQDRKFETYKNTFTSIDNYLNLRELPPSISERGVIMYEIPMDAMSYSFFVMKAGTNEVSKIILK